MDYEWRTVGGCHKQTALGMFIYGAGYDNLVVNISEVELSQRKGELRRGG